MDETRLTRMLDESLDMIVDLGEAINSQELRLSALLVALGETVPGFARAFVQAHAAEVAARQKSDNEGNPSVHGMLEQIRKLRET